MAHTPSTKIQYGLTKSEEVERFRAASARIVARAKKDRNYALRLLRDVGYFDMPPVDEDGEPIASASLNTSKPKAGKTSTKRTKAK